MSADDQLIKEMRVLHAVRTVINKWMQTHQNTAKGKTEVKPAYTYFSSHNFSEEYKMIFAPGLKVIMKQTLAVFNIVFGPNSGINAQRDQSWMEFDVDTPITKQKLRALDRYSVVICEPCTPSPIVNTAGAERRAKRRLYVRPMSPVICN